MSEPLLRPSIFDDAPNIFAAFTTRHFAGPSRAQAEAAASRLAEEEGFFGTALTEQVHEGRVAVVKDPGTVPRHDGLATRRHGLLLGTVAADCALVLLADPEAGVVATCHAGWRGAVAGIVPRAIEVACELGGRAENLRVFVGPCISVEAFEVGEEVAEQFDAAFVRRRSDWDRPHVDLRGIVSAQLAAAGVAPAHVETSDSCTVLTPDLYYSYRGENGTGGRMLGLIGLR